MLYDVEEEKPLWKGFLDREKVFEIIKYQTYEVRPMDRENAKILLASQKKQLFLTFIDIETNKVNVIFKLNDGKNFGIVEPEV